MSCQCSSFASREVGGEQLSQWHVSAHADNIHASIMPGQWRVWWLALRRCAPDDISIFHVRMHAADVRVVRAPAIRTVELVGLKTSHRKSSDAGRRAIYGRAAVIRSPIPRQRVISPNRDEWLVLLGAWVCARGTTLHGRRLRGKIRERRDLGVRWSG